MLTRGVYRTFPCYQNLFRIIQGLITNFHLPGSTLLMLECAFGGTDRILAAYQNAVDNKFRFYSYGNACLIID
ncbi:MAG: S-adenosylmethionine:tRNA ribosyltransferase-isomerase [Desulfomonilaceae bacterium]